MVYNIDFQCPGKSTKIKIKTYYFHFKTGITDLLGVKNQNFDIQAKEHKGLKDSQYFPLPSKISSKAQDTTGPL